MGSWNASVFGRSAMQGMSFSTSSRMSGTEIDDDETASIASDDEDKDEGTSTFFRVGNREIEDTNAFMQRRTSGLLPLLRLAKRLLNQIRTRLFTLILPRQIPLPCWTLWL